MADKAKKNEIKTAEQSQDVPAFLKVKRPSHVPEGWVAYECLDGYVFTPDPDGYIPNSLVTAYFLEEVPTSIEKNESYTYQSFYTRRRLCIIDVPSAKLTEKKIKAADVDFRLVAIVVEAVERVLEAIDSAKKLRGPLVTV